MSLPALKSPDVREGDMEAAVIECQHYEDRTEAFYLVRALQYLVMGIR